MEELVLYKLCATCNDIIVIEDSDDTVGERSKAAKWLVIGGRGSEPTD